MSINLHEVVGDALSIVNDWQALIFTKVVNKWVPESREPIRTETQITMQGKVQPASLQELREVGFNLTEYQYFKVFITGTPTQIDRLRQFGADTFICGDYLYKVVAKEQWDDAGWREIYAYRIKFLGDNNGTKSNL